MDAKVKPNKAKAKPKKAKLNRKGILQLADDLVANKKRYDQGDLGRKDECGTFCCLAGMCYLREIGLRKFNRTLNEYGHLPTDAVIESGLRQLGLSPKRGSHSLEGIEYKIFQDIRNWPSDLYSEYESNGPTWRVIAALKALQRLKPDGTIDQNPKAVHTRLPQLKALLATVKKVKVAA